MGALVSCSVGITRYMTKTTLAVERTKLVGRFGFIACVSAVAVEVWAYGIEQP
jgi:hypothetical protein